jgi:hypothetical protein
MAKRKMTKFEVLQLVTDWRNEKDPVAEAYGYAELMARIIDQWAVNAPETIEIEEG